MSQAPYEKPKFAIFEEGEAPRLSQVAPSTASLQQAAAQPVKPQQELEVTTVSL
jgi:hypothetical protein